MVREQEVRGQVLAHGHCVLLHEPLPLVTADVLEVARFEVGVAVEDEHRQRPVEPRPDVLGAPEVVFLGARVLREDDDLVPSRLQARARERV